MPSIDALPKLKRREPHLPPEIHKVALREKVIVRLAAFRCPETDRLGRLLGAPLAVIAAAADIDAHARRLAETWHAAYAPREAWFDAFDDGLAGPDDVAYAHHPFDPRWMGHYSLSEGMSLDGGCLTVALPRGCSAADFGPLFAMAMADRGFCAVASKPSGVRRRFASGRPLHLPPRYALARPHSYGDVRLVDDLYVFRPCLLPAIAAAAAMAANGLSIRSLIDA